MNFSANEWMYLAATAAGIVVWFVRLEGRVNLLETRHADYAIRVADLRATENRHFDEKFKAIEKTLQSIEAKLDLLAPFGLGLRGLGRRVTDPESP